MDLYWQTKWAIDAKSPNPPIQPNCSEAAVQQSVNLSGFVPDRMLEEFESVALRAWGDSKAFAASLPVRSNLTSSDKILIACVALVLGIAGVGINFVSPLKPKAQGPRILFWFLWRFFGVPNFTGDFSRQWLNTFKRACRLEKPWFSRWLAPYGGPAVASILTFCCFGAFALIAAIAPNSMYAYLEYLDRSVFHQISISLLRFWYAVETVSGWVLISSVAVGAASVIGRAQRAN
jgi:hypothetical protein